MGERGFETLKAEPTGLQTVPFGRSGTPPQPGHCSREGERPRGVRGLSVGRPLTQDLRAAARPPLRPAAFFWSVVPPCFDLPPEPDCVPPRAVPPGEGGVLAAP